MKKNLLYLISLALMVATLVSCDSAPVTTAQEPTETTEQATSETTRQAPPETTEKSTSPAPPEYVDAILENFHIAIATDELLSKYDSFHEYIADEDAVSKGIGDKVIIWTDTEINDFAFITVDLAGGEKLNYSSGDILFSADKLLPEKPFVVEIIGPELIPFYGISYLDENGVTRYFTIEADGRGAEEAPPIHLLEFENGKR